MKYRETLKIMTIIGARPQFIKASAVSRAVKNHNFRNPEGVYIQEVIVHTGQHYDENMSRIFFDDLALPEPDYNLGVGSASHGMQTGEMLGKIEKVVYTEYPDMVLVYGDTNSTIAGALIASKVKYDESCLNKNRKQCSSFTNKALRPILVHIEAGLRSYNRRMPEEVNRVVSDELSDILFCPTDTAVKNLKKEGIGNNKVSRIDLSANRPSCIVFNAGDVMYDTALYYLKIAEKKPDILNRMNLFDSKNNLRPFILCTVHRAENTDDTIRLRSIIKALNYVSDQGIKVVLPLHPRTRKIIGQNNIAVSFEIFEPFGYLEMILLEKHAVAIATDSGGMQKEAYFFKTPCITLRDETEWIETVKSGWNILAGADTKKIIKYCLSVAEGKGKNKEVPFRSSGKSKKTAFNSNNYYGSGNASDKIIEYLLNLCNYSSTKTL